MPPQPRTPSRGSGVLASFVVVGMLIAWGVPVAAEVTLEPALTLSRSTGPPSTRVVVAGSGFEVGETIDVSFDAAELVVIEADATGAFSGARIKVPGSAKPGIHAVSAHGRASGISADAVFLVRTDWPQYRGDAARVGFNRYENVLKVSNVDRLRRIWNVDTGAEVVSSATVVAGVVYFGLGTGDLYALDATTGDELWNAPRGSWASPAVADGVVYVAEGQVAALDAATGEPLWSSGEPGEQFGSSPALVDGVLFAVSTNGDVPEGEVAAFDRTTGNRLWSRSIPTNTWAAPAVGGGAVFVATLAGRIHSLDTSTGAILWSERLPCTRHCYILNTPTVAGGRVFVPYPGTGGICALDAQTGELLWKRMDGPASPIAVADGVVYFGSGTGDVYARRASTGSLVWRNHVHEGDVESGPTLANGVLFVGGNDDTVHALDAANGELLWEYRTGRGVASSPTVVDGMVYVGSRDGTIYAFGLP